MWLSFWLLRMHCCAWSVLEAYECFIGTGADLLPNLLAVIIKTAGGESSLVKWGYWVLPGNSYALAHDFIGEVHMPSDMMSAPPLTWFNPPVEAFCQGVVLEASMWELHGEWWGPVVPTHYPAECSHQTPKVMPLSREWMHMISGSMAGSATITEKTHNAQG